MHLSMPSPIGGVEAYTECHVYLLGIFLIILFTPDYNEGGG